MAKEPESSENLSASTKPANASLVAIAPDKSKVALATPLKLSANLLKLLQRIGIVSQEDLMLHFPLRYEDETKLIKISLLHPGDSAQIEGNVTDVQIITHPFPRMEVLLSDDSGEIKLRFFNFYQKQKELFIIGNRIRAYGEISMGYYGLEIAHPRCRIVNADEPLANTLTPIYPSTSGLAQSAIQKLVKKNLSYVKLDDTLGKWRPNYLPEFKESLWSLHFPAADIDVQQWEQRLCPAWQRVKFDELLAQQLSMQKARRMRKDCQAIALNIDGNLLANDLIKQFGHPLTAAQERVLGEINQDLQAANPMLRLLQGDVGCGKTIVAALACCRALVNNLQVAIMAPTEILAEQHFNKFSSWFTPLGIEVVWLAGKLSAKQKKQINQQISTSAQIIVGTHALIQDSVNYHSLGLVIIDEQHRFGVMQRLSLNNKGNNPHQLMMSATPIPRTLAMSYYADLDISQIDQLPPGRTPINTRLKSVENRDKVIDYIKKQIATGQQVYWVCPLIEESEKLQLETAIDTYNYLLAKIADIADKDNCELIGLVHGRMKGEEKKQVMAKFSNGDTKLLVATTVIEVGVDVPNASIMVIENAERFGLSQLHQLRGRVGRGAAKSQCILLYSKPLSYTAKERLRIIYENSDGFLIAQEDLRLRGPGEFVGSRQSGTQMFRYADLETDQHLLSAATDLARKLLAEDLLTAEKHLQRWLGIRQQYAKG